MTPPDTSIECFTSRESPLAGRTLLFGVNAKSTSSKFRILRDDEILPSGLIEMSSRLARTNALWSSWKRFQESSFQGQTIGAVRGYFSYEYDTLFRVPVTLPTDAPLEPGDTEEE